VPAPAGAIMGTELTVVDVAARLHRPISYVRELLRRKKLPGYRRGKYWVIPEADLLAWQTLCRGLDDQGGTTLPSIGHPGRGPAHPRAARPGIRPRAPPRSEGTGRSRSGRDGCQGAQPWLSG
jgi:excisionase family DNA binding protein